MLGSAELGVLLFLAQVAAGYLSAALLARLGGTLRSMTHPAVPTASQPLRLDGIIAQAAQTYLKLCGFVLFFRCWPQERGKHCLRCRRFLRDAFRGLLWL